MIKRRWRIPAKVVDAVNPRSYIVQLEGGTRLRRNRHQLQLRPNEGDRKRDEGEEAWEEDEDAVQEGEGITDVEEADVEEEGETQPEDQQQQRMVTRSGRQICKPGWMRDYTT